MLRNLSLTKIQGHCHCAALKWNGSTQVVPYIDFDVTKLVLTESVKHQVGDEDVFHDLLVHIDAVGQDDFGHLQAHVHRLADVAVHVQVLEGVLGDGAPHAGLAVFGHGAPDLDLGGLTVAIATGDLHHGMAHI